MGCHELLGPVGGDHVRSCPALHSGDSLLEACLCDVEWLMFWETALMSTSLLASVMCDASFFSPDALPVLLSCSSGWVCPCAIVSLYQRVPGWIVGEQVICSLGLCFSDIYFQPSYKSCKRCLVVSWATNYHPSRLPWFWLLALRELPLYAFFILHYYYYWGSGIL